MEQEYLVRLINEGGPVLLAMAIPALLAGLKRVWETVPKGLLPFAAVVVGVAADYALAKVGALEAHGPVTGALVGLAGVGVREVVDRVKKFVKE